MEQFQRNAFLTLERTLESSLYNMDPQWAEAMWINFIRWMEIDYDVMKYIYS